MFVIKKVAQTKCEQNTLSSICGLLKIPLSNVKDVHTLCERLQSQDIHSHTTFLVVCEFFFFQELLSTIGLHFTILAEKGDSISFLATGPDCVWRSLDKREILCLL
jgi:hypothetical protein